VWCSSASGRVWVGSPASDCSELLKDKEALPLAKDRDLVPAFGKEQESEA